MAGPFFMGAFVAGVRCLRRPVGVYALRGGVAW